MNRYTNIILLAMTAGASSASLTDNLLYEQLSPTSQGGAANVYYSNPVQDQIMYDQFGFDAGVSLDGVGFWGAIYADTSFTITIYESNTRDGLPGAIAHQQEFATVDLDIQLSGQAIDDNHWLTEEHHILAEFDNSFNADADHNYWLAITGDTLFGWTFEALSGDNSVLYSNTAQDSFWTQDDLGLDPTNLAYSLYGTPLPTPSTTLLITGMFGFVSSRRRRIC